MGVSKNMGIPKWMVYNGSKPYEQMDDLGGFPIIFGSTPIWKLVNALVAPKDPIPSYKS